MVLMLRCGNSLAIFLLLVLPCCRSLAFSNTLLMLRCGNSLAISNTLLMLCCGNSLAILNTLLMLHCGSSLAIFHRLLMLRCWSFLLQSNTLLVLCCGSSPAISKTLLALRCGERNRLSLSQITCQNKMQPTNPNAHTYVNGTDVETHGFAVTQNAFLKQFIWTVLCIILLLPNQCTVDCGIWKKVAC